MKYFAIALLTFCTLGLAMPVYAEKPAHAGKRGEIHWDKKEGGSVQVRFDLNDRNIIQSYLKRNYGQSCPPGLAKKNNGCLPPGQAKKYGIGGILPGGYHSLPGALAAALGVPPRGTFYAMVDKDVLLVSEATKRVLDAVTLLSAVQN